MLKNFIKLFIPPVFFWIKNFNKMRKEVKLRKQYTSFDEAIQSSIQAGYSNSYLVDVNCIRSLDAVNSVEIKNFIETDFMHINACFSIFLIIISNKQADITVIDFGGGAGENFFYLKKMIKDVSLRYIIVETAEMCDKARQIFKDERILYYDSLDEALNSCTRVDLIIASGSLQYVPDPYGILDKIVNSNAGYLLISRCSLTTRDLDLITVQEYTLTFNGKFPMPDGYTDQLIRYPHVDIQKAKFEKIIFQKYDLLVKLNDDSGLIGSRDESIVGGSYFLKSKPC